MFVRVFCCWTKKRPNMQLPFVSFISSCKKKSAMTQVKYCSKVSWQSRLDPRNLILASRIKVETFEFRGARMESQASRIEKWGILEYSWAWISYSFIEERTIILKKSTTTLSLQNTFRSIFDHLQLQVVHHEFEFHLKLRCDWAYLQYYMAIRV